MPTIERIPRTSGDSAYRIQADLVDEGSRTRVWFESNGFPLDDTIDPFVALALIPSMARNRDIVATEPVSIALRSRIFPLHDQLRWRIPGIQAVGIDAPARAGAPHRAHGVGLFMDGDIDSLASLVGGGERITHVIHVHGLRTQAGQTEERRIASDWLERLSAEYGVVPIEVATNVRGWSDPQVSWERFHPLGPLAAVAAALSPVIGEAWIPGESLESTHRSRGVHPARLMGTDAVDLCPDDAGTDRAGRYEKVAERPGALRWLRPCRRSRGAGPACGECPACIEALIALQALGTPDTCPEFRIRPQPRRIARLTWETEASRRTAHRLLNVCERRGHDRELATALRRSLGLESDSTERRWWQWTRLVSR